MIEQEKIISGYNHAIMRRLLAFLKPYKTAVIFAVIALFLSTAGQLILPVILQRSIDHELIVYYFRIPEETLREGRIENLEIDEETPRIGEYYYIHKNVFEVVSDVKQKSLSEQGLMEKTRYYIFPSSDETLKIVSGNESLFIVGSEYIAVKSEDLSRFEDDEIRLLRNHDIDNLINSSLIFLIVLGGVFIFTFAQIYLMAYSGQGVMKDLRLKLYNHTICQSLSFLDTNPVGRLVTRVTNDVETINELFTTVLINFLKDISLMVGVIVTLFLLNFRLGLVTILTLPPVFLITFYFRTKAREAFRRVRLWLSTVNTYLSEHISGMRIVQIFVQEERCKNEFREKNDELMRANLGEVYVFAVFRPLIDLLSSTSIAVIIYFSARHFLEGIVSMGIVVAFINLIRKFYQPVRDISEKYTILQSAMAGSERVFELLDVEKRIPDSGGNDVSETGSGRIEFDSVWFSYKEGEPVIRDLSFSVEPGETVAIVGYTGAGKTTIANLLTRLWDIQEGSIRIDGKDIREIKISELRKAIQPVQQDVFLFNDSIAENIRLGKEITKEKIIEASKLVQAHSFITEQDGGYNRQLNEGATNISTGQRQLLSFARVIAHNPKIVILDEATSNIDTETEKLIQAAMEEVMKNRTSIVIAHRLSTIKHADRILVLSRGKLVEQGKHEELLRKKGVYYTLYRLQYQD